MSLRPRLVICDDEAAARRGVVRALGADRYEFVECEDGARCLEALARQGADLVLLDLRMPVLDGASTLARIRELPAPPPVVVLTADQTLRSAIDAVKAGAADYLAKPFDIEELRLTVARTLAASRLADENQRLRDEVRRLGGGAGLVGQSEALREILAAVARVAPTQASVLITGETGTGKELVARRLHELSPAAAGPFIAVNCAAIPETLFESELFGHVKGAFTGADRDRPGKLREADGGTLFLDEVGDMPLAAQAKLLRVLQDGVVEPLGGGRAVNVRVRVLAATHRDLKALVSEARFRDDLYYRLRVVEIEMPPLRERGEDIALLAGHFLDLQTQGRLKLDSAALEALAAYAWPGNVRELRNAIERAAIFCRDGVVRVGDLPAEVRGTAGEAEASLDAMVDRQPGEDFASAKRRAVERFERVLVETALREHKGNVSHAAAALGLHRQNLQQKMRELGLSSASFREQTG